MPHQVDGAFVHAPCPVPSCPAYEPNSGSVFPSLSTRAHSSRGGPALLCNQVDFTLPGSPRPWEQTCPPAM